LVESSFVNETIVAWFRQLTMSLSAPVDEIALNVTLILGEGLDAVAIWEPIVELALILIPVYVQYFSFTLRNEAIGHLIA